MSKNAIPLSVLFGNPERLLPSISPDGDRLAWLAPVDGVLNLWVDGHPVTRDTTRGIQSYRWTHEGQHLLWLQDIGGDENTHLWCLDLDAGAVVDLTPFDDVRATLVATDLHAPSEVVVGLNRRDPRAFDLYRIDVVRRTCELVVENPDVEDWLVGPGLNVVGATQMRDDGNVRIIAPTADGWRTVLDDVGDFLAVLPLGVTASGRVVLRTDKDSPTRRLTSLDMTTGELTTLLADPVYDIQTATLHPSSREPQLAVVERERAETVVLDEAVRADIDALAHVHDGRPAVISRDSADSRWVVGFLSDRGPVAHYLWDRETRTARFLFDHRPEMRQYEWAAMEPFSFTARDGLRIHGYLSFPRGAERTGLPAVVDVHGGPWRRNVWGFDPEAQWLANRGYLAVQVNFRGSAGYGRDFLDAGDKEWGGRMHDDVVDAVRHLTNTGVLDPERVGIMGVSYGGYEALCGVTFSSDVFACGVARVGPSNLITFIESLPPYWQPTVELWHRRVGHPEHDRELLWSRSPLSRAHELRRPLMLVHGARDPRVPQRESDAMAAALAANGIDQEYLVFPDEGHGITRPENRQTLYDRAESFLARHLQR